MKNLKVIAVFFLILMTSCISKSSIKMTSGDLKYTLINNGAGYALHFDGIDDLLIVEIVVPLILRNLSH